MQGVVEEVEGSGEDAGAGGAIEVVCLAGVDDEVQIDVGGSVLVVGGEVGGLLDGDEGVVGSVLDEDVVGCGEVG